MKYKFLLVIASMLFVFSSVGCGNVSEETEMTTEETTFYTPTSEYEAFSPENVVDSFLKCYKAGEFDAMKNYLLDKNSYFDTISQNLAIMVNDMVENFEYEIKDCKVESDSSAYVTVDMKNIKVSEIAMDTLSDYNGSQVAKNSEATDEEISNELLRILNEKVELYKKDGKINKTVTINLYRQDGEDWKIVNDADMFDGMTGNCMSFISRNLQNFVAENGQVDVTEN